MLNRSLPIAALILSVLPAAPVPADPPGPPAEVIPDVPTAQMFRDWTLTCNIPPCVAATSVISASGEDILRLELTAEPAPGFVLRTPLPLYLPDGLTLTAGQGDPVGHPWYTCANATCEARVPFDARLDAMFRREGSVTVTLRLVDGTQIRLPVSLLGYAAASEALAGTRVRVSP